MTVLRLVADFAVPDPAAGRAFYGDLLGLEPVMDQGWVVTWAAPDGAGGPASRPRPQVTLAREGGAGAPIPDLSVEVDDVDALHARAVAAGFDVLRPLTDEPWGVRRLFLRDPFGRVINILQHI